MVTSYGVHIRITGFIVYVHGGGVVHSLGESYIIITIPEILLLYCILIAVVISHVYAYTTLPNMVCEYLSCYHNLRILTLTLASKHLGG